MTIIEEQLRDLADMPVSVPDRVAQRAWVVGRHQRRRQVRIGVSAVALAGGVLAGVLVAHPALAGPENTVAASLAQHVGRPSTAVPPRPAPGSTLCATGPTLP